MSLTFRWLGVAGLEFCAGSQRLAIDPFFTRPSLLQLLRPLQSDASLAFEKLPTCDAILVTHSHYDHLLDVPAILCHAAAVAYGSANTCRLLRLSGLPERQVCQVQPGESLSLGAFHVEVIAGQHGPLPFSRLLNGPLRQGTKLPLHFWDYRMDACFGYRLTVLGIRLLVCAARPRPADVLFAVAQETGAYYQQLFAGVSPRLFFPIHWELFTRPLHQPLRRFTRPGRPQLSQITRLARQLLPATQVIIPEIFREYTLI